MNKSIFLCATLNNGKWLGFCQQLRSWCLLHQYPRLITFLGNNTQRNVQRIIHLKMNKTIIIIKRGRCRRVTGLNFTTTIGQIPKVTIYFSYFRLICIMPSSTYDSALLDFGCSVFARFVISTGLFKTH